MSTRSDESSSPSIRNSSNARTLNFFRNIVGQKHADYHSDAPQTADAAPSRVASTRTIGSRGTGALISIRGIVSERGAEGGVAGWCSRSCACFAWPPVARHAFWNAIIRSTAWQFMLIVLTIVLLFGAQVRDLWIPKAGDDAVDYVFLGAFIVFTADILIRIDVEPNYFCFAFFCWRPKNEQMTADMPSGWVGCGSCRLGSFLFWCDVVSTLTLLYEISFINSSSFEEQSIRIDLNAFGIPVRACSRIDYDLVMCRSLASQLADSLNFACFNRIDLFTGGWSRGSQRIDSSPDGRGQSPRYHCQDCTCRTLHPIVYCGQDIIIGQLVLVVQTH